MTSRLLDDWLKAYLVYTAESESPDSFHIWTALSTIAGALRRKVWFTMGYFDLRPNMFVVLVSPAGRCKKSTAMRIGRGVLANVPGVHLTTDSVTRERLIVDLSQTAVDGHSSMTAYSTEFASLLTSSGIDMVTFLTDIYDSPDEWSHRTKIGGTQKIRAPFLNLIGATTPEWMARSLPLDTIGIGLTSRIIFVYEDTPRVRPPFPKLSKEQIELGELLARDLHQIALISGQYQLDAEAQTVYESWYTTKHQGDRPLHDPRLAGYYERKPMHLLKVAMSIAASQRDETVITKRDLEHAFELLTAIEPAMERTFSGVGKNPLNADIDAILEVISREPGTEFATLFKMFKHSVRIGEIEEVLRGLQSTRQVRVVQTEHGPTYFPGTEGENNKP